MNESGILSDVRLTPYLQAIVDDLSKRFGPTFKRLFNIDATDANTGTFTHFTDKSITWDELVEASVASSSIPGVFPTTLWKGKVYYDGGVIWTADLSSGVQRCRELVDSDSKITVDIMITHPYKKSRFEHLHNSIGNILRFHNIKALENSLGGVLKFMKAFPEVNFRHFAVPSSNIEPGPSRLDFNDRLTHKTEDVGK